MACRVHAWLWEITLSLSFRKTKGPRKVVVFMFLNKIDYRVAEGWSFSAAGLVSWLPLQSAGTHRPKSYRQLLPVLQGPCLVFDSFCFDTSEQRVNSWEGNLASAEFGAALSCIYNRLALHLVFSYNGVQIEHDSC